MFLVWSTGGEGKPPQLCLNPEVGRDRYHWGGGGGGVPEQAPLAAPVTSEGTTEEGIATEQNLFLLSIPWELTHPATATVKCPGHFINLPKAHYHFPEPCNLG